jgi:broad specificity phosphatase PhoE
MPLADRIAPFRPVALVASDEPKAAETAALVGGRLGLPVSLDDRLREHDREDEGWMGTAAFHTAIARLFERPEERVFGRETARQAEVRFSGAVAEALAWHPAGTVVVVAHGTAISLFCAGRTGVDGFALWDCLGLPSVVVLSRPDLRLVDVVGEVGADERSDDGKVVEREKGR